MDWAPFYDSEIDYYIPAEPRHPDVEQLLPEREPDLPSHPEQPLPSQPLPALTLTQPTQNIKTEIYEELWELVKLEFVSFEPIYQKINELIPKDEHIELWYELLQIPLTMYYKLGIIRVELYGLSLYPIRSLSYLLIDKPEVSKFIFTNHGYNCANFIEALIGILPNVDEFVKIYNYANKDHIKIYIITRLLNSDCDQKSVISVIARISNDIIYYKQTASVLNFINISDFTERCYVIENILSVLKSDDLYKQAIEQDYQKVFKFLRLHYPFNLEKHFFRIKHNFVNDKYNILRELLPLAPKLALDLLCSEPNNNDGLLRKVNNDIFRNLLNNAWQVIKPNAERSLYNLMFDVGIKVQTYGLLCPIIKRGKIQDLSKYKRLILEDQESTSYLLHNPGILGLRDQFFNINNFTENNFIGVTNEDPLLYMVEQSLLKNQSMNLCQVVNRVGYRDLSYTFRILKSFIEMKPYPITTNSVDLLELQFLLSMGIRLSLEFKKYDLETKKFIWKSYFIKLIEFKFVIK